MNKSPFNYLLTAAFAAVLWIVTAIFYGLTFSESLMLAVSTPEDFLAKFRMMLGIAAAIGLINCLYWYYFGGLNSIAGNLGRAKRVWWASFVVQIIVCAGILFGLVLMNLNEGIQTSDWLIALGLLSLHTWVFFWLCTYFMSPRAVKNIPLFR